MEFLFYAISAAALAAITSGRRHWAYALLAVSVGFLFLLGITVSFNGLMPAGSY